MIRASRRSVVPVAVFKEKSMLKARTGTSHYSVVNGGIVRRTLRRRARPYILALAGPVRKGMS